AQSGRVRTAKGVAARASAAGADTRIIDGIKAVINDAAVVATAEKVLKAAFGDRFRTVPPGTASEDFSEYINAGVPSMMFNVGVYDPERVAAARNGGPPIPGNHSPLF